MMHAQFFRSVKFFVMFSSLFCLNLIANEIPAESSGACSGRDLHQFYKSNFAFAETIDTCSSYSGLARECVRKNYSPEVFSEPCLSCFAAMTSCTVSNCAVRCLFSGRRSIECKQCSVENCGQAMQTCSGVEPAKWPDFRRKGFKFVKFF